MAQFTGRRDTSWVWVVVALLVLAAAVIVYLAMTQPDFFSFLQIQPMQLR